MEISLKNKKYLITGSSSGIGKAVSRKLLKEGANVCLIDINNIDSEQIIADAKDDHVSFALRCDLSNYNEIENVFLQCRERGFVLDGLVHCAGLSPLMKVSENDIETCEKTFAVNYFSFLEMMKHYSKEGAANDGGSVIAMSSASILKASVRQSVYSASKAALNQSVRAIANEMLPRKIRVNTIIANAVQTEMFNKLAEKSENLIERTLINQPLGIIPPENIAEVVCFLLSDYARFITGGGYLLTAGSFYK